MQSDKDNTKKYPLAPAWRRIVAKVLDILLISILVIALGFAIFCTDPNFKWHEKLVLEQNWRYGLFTTIMAILFFGLMFLLPTLWKKTIGMKAMNLEYFNKNEKGFFAGGIFIHELFVWGFIVILAFAMGWTLTGLNDQTKIDSLIEGASSIFANKPADNLDKVCYYVGTGFTCFYSICLLILSAIIIGTCIKSNRPAFHDKYSQLYVIYKVSLETYKPVNRPKLIKGNEDIIGPGVITPKSMEEIENIE